MQKTFYKVCDVSSGKCYSYIYGITGYATVEYKLNEYVYPITPGHYLSVFKDLKSARKFYNTYCQKSSYTIFECEVEGLCENPVNYLKIFDGNVKPGAKFVYGVKLIKPVEDTIERKAMQINEFIPELEKRGWTFEYHLIEQGNDGIITERKYVDEEFCYAVKIYNENVGFSFITPSVISQPNIVEIIQCLIGDAIDENVKQNDESDNILESFLEIFTTEELQSFIGV